MRYLRIIILIIHHLFWSGSESFALDLKPGDTFPSLETTDIRNHKKASWSIADNRGQWTIINFWSMGCPNAIKAIPRMLSLQNQFPGTMQIVLVGKTEGRQNAQNRELFDRFVRHYNSKVIGVFSQKFFDALNIQSVPELYIVDPEGIIRFITDGTDLTREKLDMLLSHRFVEFRRHPKHIIAELQPIDLPNSAGQREVLFTSTLSKWNKEFARTDTDINSYITQPNIKQAKGLQKIMIPLSGLYVEAYFGTRTIFPDDTLRYGKQWTKPSLEMDDPSLFEYDYHTGHGFYNYYFNASTELSGPETIQRDLQDKLKVVFGYEVTIERRKIPVWKFSVISRNSNHPQICGDEFPWVSDSNPLIELNICDKPINILRKISVYLPGSQKPLIDETGITDKISLQIKSLLTDFENVRAELRQYNLDVSPDEHEMEVIVIKDARK